MSFEINELKTDKKMEAEGVWVKEEGGLELKIARLDNPEYRRFVAKKSKPFRRQIARGNIESLSDKMENIIREAFARFILLDWKNLTEKGKELKYTYENAYRILGIKDFFEIVESHAANAEIYRQETIKDAEKNSPAASNGS